MTHTLSCDQSQQVDSTIRMVAKQILGLRQSVNRKHKNYEFLVSS